MATMNPSQMNEDEPPTGCGDGQTALVVDDHPEIVLLITPWLRALGYRVLAAADGREAQGIIQEHGIASVDLLVTDLNMPRMGGGELIQWLLQENPRVRVLVMSGSPGQTQLPGEVVLLQKPFRAAAFNARLRELLSVPAETSVSRPKRKHPAPTQIKAFGEPGHEEIACGAYNRWRAEGCREDSADKHWFASETELTRQQPVHADSTRSTGQELDNLAQRAQHTVTTGERLSVQTARLSVQADEHETLCQERAAEDALATEERSDGVA